MACLMILLSNVNTHGALSSGSAGIPTYNTNITGIVLNASISPNANKHVEIKLRNDNSVFLWMPSGATWTLVGQYNFIM